MIANTYEVPTKVGSRAYKLLSSEVGPPSSVKHFAVGCFFAQFGPFTLAAKPAKDAEGSIVLTVYFHEEAGTPFDVIAKRLAKSINTMSGSNHDILNPFS
jgi:hypothetical protein